MNLRRLRPQDYDKINTLWEKCHKNKFGIPPRRFLVTEAITENDSLTGYGIVRFFAEALLYLDKEKSPFEQAKSFKLLLEQAIIDCKNNGLDQLNVFTDDEHFKRILQRYDFKERDKGLFLEL